MRFDLKIHKPFTGLFNQIFALIYGIHHAKNNNKKIIILKDLMREVKRPDMLIPISEVINIEETNKLLKENMNIILLDANNIKIQIEKAQYFDKNEFIDVTNFIKNNYFKNNKLFIPKNTNFKKFMTKKNIEIQQKLQIDLNINGYLFKRLFDINQGFNKIDINIDYTKFNFQFMFLFPNKSLENFYSKCLKNIIFCDKYRTNLEKLIGKKYDKINLCHLRIEIDGLEHWSKMNNTDPSNFKTKIENIYIGLIKKYFDKESLNIILSYSTNNKVINFLKNNNYPYFILEKDKSEGREINALRDFLLGLNCNNVFIGAQGSSFTWGLNVICKATKKVFFNLNNIKKTKIINSSVNNDNNENENDEKNNEEFEDIENINEEHVSIENNNKDNNNENNKDKDIKIQKNKQKISIKNKIKSTKLKKSIKNINKNKIKIFKRKL